MTSTYQQFCPVAKAAEIFAERWTPLVVRELLCGSTRFNQLRRGLPLMSPSLLTRRLRSLEDHGLLKRHHESDGTVEYHLTDAGQALQPVLENLGAWGKRWVQREVHADELDAGLLMWDIHRRLHIEKLPDHRTVLQFEFIDLPAKQRCYWLILAPESVDICLKQPGFEVDLLITSDVRTLTQVWLGDLPLQSALRQKRIRLEGSRDLAERFQSWLMLSLFADIERQNT